MVVKEITYLDYDGNEITEPFYFNLRKDEIVKMEMGVAGGLTKKIQQIISTRDTTKILPIFEDFILKSYGVRSDDGKRFIKSRELAEEFTQTNAYSQMFMEFITNPDKFAEFVNGLIEGANTPDKPVIVEASGSAAAPAITPVK